MASNLKLLLIWRDDSNHITVSALTGPGSDGKLTYLNHYVLQQTSFRASNPGSLALSDAVWNPADGTVSMIVSGLVSPATSASQLCKLHTGRYVSEVENLDGTNNGASKFGLFLAQGTAWPSYVGSPRGLWIAYKAADWIESGKWNGNLLTQNGDSVDYGCSWLNVGNDWVYAVYQSFSDLTKLHVIAVPTDNLQSIAAGFPSSPESPLKIGYANGLRMYAYAANSGPLQPRTALLLTGSTSTTRKVHLFQCNSSDELRYAYFSLMSNGLPNLSYPAERGDSEQRFDVSGEVRIGDKSLRGPCSAVTSAGWMYVFCQDSQGIAVCYSRRVDGDDSWALQNISNMPTVGTDLEGGGVKAVFVQANF